MVASVVAGALVSGASSLLGGLFGKNSAEKATRDQNYYNRPRAQRQRAEGGGFNPLFVMSNGASGNQTQSGYSPIMGNSIAQAGAAFAGAMQAEEQLKIQRSELEMENQRLDELVKATKLTANVGGIYAKGNRNNGSGNLGSSSNPNGYGRSGDVVAPDRDQEVAPYVSGAGLTEINNSFTGGSVVVPGDDGEPWGIDEVATAAIFGAPQVFYRQGKRFGNWMDQRKADRSMDEWFRRSREGDAIRQPDDVVRSRMMKIPIFN